jgi:hypothetical protein
MVIVAGAYGYVTFLILNFAIAGAMRLVMIVHTINSRQLVLVAMHILFLVLLVLACARDTPGWRM